MNFGSTVSQKIRKSPGPKNSWNQIIQFHEKFIFWPNSIFCNFKNGQKSIFELGKSLKLPEIQFHEKKKIYLISRVFLPGFSGPLCLIRSFPCCFIPKVNNRSDHSISVQVPIIMSGSSSRSLKFEKLLKNVLKFIKGITFEPAFFLYMLAHGFYVMTSATMYIDKVRLCT